MVEVTSSTSSESEGGTTPTKRTSPGRVASIASRIVSFVASPLRMAADRLSPSTDDDDMDGEKNMIIDEEIVLKGRGISNGGLVMVNDDDAGGAGGGFNRMNNNSLETQSTTSGENFFTPATSGEVLSLNNVDIRNISKESFPPRNFNLSLSMEQTVSSGELQGVNKEGGGGGGGESTRTNNAPQMQEFEPYSLIAFDSPTSSSVQSFQKVNKLTNTVTTTPIKGVSSLLDGDNEGVPLCCPLVSPSLKLKYTESDFIELKNQLEERLERQVEFLQYEIDTLQEKYSTALRTGEEMRVMLRDYELAMAQIVENRHQNGGEQPLTVEHLTQDKRQLMVDLQAMQIAFANLKQRYDENKTINEQLCLHEQSLKANIIALQTDLSNSDRRYEVLRKHAEEKLNEANEELHRLKSTLEIELSATKAKLYKAELKVSSLESTVDSKTRENSELMAICDELIQKIDSQAAAAGNSRSAAVLASLNINRGTIQ